jgi:predicted DNA-binding ribbon-helix-helix protein
MGNHMAHNNKRSIELRGHRTSLKIEDEFWYALRQMAAEQNIGVTALIGRIAEHAHAQENLSSAVRTFVLKHYQRKNA